MNNNRQSGDIVLATYGGLCVEVAATDLPEGASPQNWDCDYDIGAVYSRAGLSSVYEFEGLNTGGLAPGHLSSIRGLWSSAGGLLSVTWSAGNSDIAFWNHFPVAISPLLSLTGVEIAITGHYSGSLSPRLTAQLTLNGQAIGLPKTFTFETGDTTVPLGAPNDDWSSDLTPDQANNISFGVQLFGTTPAGVTVSLFVSSVTLTVFNSQGRDQIDWLKTFVEDDQHTHSFVLDSAGVLWEEDVTLNPGVLTPELTTIYPNQFAHSTTNLDEEWIAFSDLRQGMNIPRHGTNFDRISQVGPGAAPNAAGNATCPTGTGPTCNSWGIVSITQAGPSTTPFQDILWSQGPSSTAPGNTLTIFYSRAPDPDPTVGVGQGIYLSGLTGAFGGLNGTYVITSAAFGKPPGGDLTRWFFTVRTVVTSPANAQACGGGAGPECAAATGTYQATTATMRLNKGATFQAGNQITIQGATPAGWNNTWSILRAMNGGDYLITGTSLTNGIATYDYTFVDGVPPTAGSFVTVTNCVNGPFVNGASIFNVTQAAIVSATGASFTVAIPGFANVPAAIEAGNAVEMGTVYQFDPGLTVAAEQDASPSTPLSAIFGNDHGTGTVALTGGLAPGVRQAVVIFETRNGYLTAPSPPVTFGVTSNDNSIVCQNICIGPPNVVARIVAFTPANGGNFFYIPTNVVVPNAGQPITYTATRIADNTTTSATFTFTDAILMAATAIDIPGNNLFNEMEIGSSLAVVSYAARNFYIGQNNKVQNFVNTTFDGGYDTPGQHHYPAGWSPVAQPGFSQGGFIKLSPVFGFSYYIQSDGSSPNGIYGLIQQSAYQDAYLQPILEPQVGYSVRIDVRAPSGITTQGGELVIDVLSSGGPLGFLLFGAAVFPLATMSTNFQTLVLPLLDKGSLPLNVPTSLQLRVYVRSLPAGADVEIDRFEVFPTARPQLLTNAYGSYVANLEAVDGVTGDLDTSTQNNQPLLGAFTQYDLLYFLKSNSMFSTQDSPSEEPADWNIREVSNRVGTAGIHAFDYGEEWMITAHRLGLFLFHGGEPQKIMQEIQPLWDAINWRYGYTIVVRNDAAQRRITIQVPLPTPNKWMPDAISNPNPMTPNVMLMCNYKELQNADDLILRGPVKISYSGRLISWDLSRKWSIWQIPSPYSAYIRRSDMTDQYFIGNGRHNSRVYQLDPNRQDDDGIPIQALYTTYGFVKSEQAQQFGPLVGEYRVLYRYSSHNLSGNGDVRLRALSNELTTPYPYEVPGGIRLTDASPDNRECPLNVEGQRLFMEYSTHNDLTAHFRLSETIVSMVKAPWAPVRGLN